MSQHTSMNFHRNSAFEPWTATSASACTIQLLTGLDESALDGPLAVRIDGQPVFPHITKRTITEKPDFRVDPPIEVPANAKVEIDVNGHFVMGFGQTVS